VFQVEDRWTEYEAWLGERYAIVGQPNSYILQIYFLERGAMYFRRQVAAYEKTAEHVYSYFLSPRRYISHSLRYFATELHCDV
jgi:hypothetical protein